MDKSFSQRTKEILCAIDVKGDCCVDAELLGIKLFGGRIVRSEKKTEEDFLLERIEYLSKRQSRGNRADMTDVPMEILENECCKGAFLRGAFLGGGTLPDPRKGYNMEISTQSEELSILLASLMDSMGLDFKRSRRKGSFLLYTKNSEVICDALTYMGAYSIQMEIINVKIEKEIYNGLNRMANSETANMDKVITAAIRQIQAIEKIDEIIGIDSIPEELREVAVIRRSNKDLSLEALGKKLTPPLSKSGVNHRIKKILDIADKL